MSGARNNVSKLRGFVFVTEPQYGAKGDGGTDDTAAIQACINANPGKFICFPPGVYVITSTLVINTDDTFLYGFGRRAVILNKTVNGDAFHFIGVGTGQWSYLNNCGLDGFYIYRPVSNPATAGAGIRLTRSNGGRFTDFYILDCAEGVQIRGGQQNKLSNFTVYGSDDMSNLSAVTDSSLFKIDESPTDGGTYQPAYTIQMTDFNIAATKRVQSVMHVASVDGLQISSAYLSGATQTVIRYKSSRNGSSITAVTWASSYIDAINSAVGPTNIIHIPDDGNPSSSIFSISHASCDFGNCPGTGILVRKSVEFLGFDGGSIYNTDLYAVDYEVATTSGSLTMTGTRLSNNNPGGSAGIIRAVRVNFINLTPTILTVSTTGPIYGFTGTINRIYVGGTVSNATTLLSKSGVINTFNFSPAARTETLSPTFAFSGGSTGLSYISSGAFVLSAGRCVGDMFITLSAKGSSTGEIVIAGLPFTPARNAPCSFLASGLSASTGDTSLHALVNQSTGTILLYKMVSGTPVQLTNADVTNTTIIQIHFDYAI